MKLQHILIFITSLLFTCTAIAQDKNTKPTDSVAVIDSVGYKQRYGLRAGIDISKLIRSALDDNYSGLELVADYRISHSWFISAELGNETKTTEEDYLNFTTKGSYIQLGPDWNAFKNWYGMENVISVGFRYGFSTFSQTLNSYTPSTSTPYWEAEGVSGSNPNLLQEYKGLNAHWLELVLAMKVEVFHNLYLGGSIRIKKMLTDKAADQFPNLWAPGFNKITDGTSFGAGYNYSISYLIPLYKKQKSKKKPEEEKETIPQEITPETEKLN